jgi:hypothetical protein
MGLGTYSWKGHLSWPTNTPMGPQTRPEPFCKSVWRGGGYDLSLTSQCYVVSLRFKSQKQSPLGPDVVVHTYNSSYSGHREQEDLGPRSTHAEGYQDSISTNKPGMVAHTYMEGIGRRIVVQGKP